MFIFSYNANHGKKMKRDGTKRNNSVHMIFNKLQMIFFCNLRFIIYNGIFKHVVFISLELPHY